MALRRRAGALAALAACVAAVAPPCDVTKSGQEVCDDYCNFRCGFYNASQGETGAPHRAQLYRITPANVTGVLNKDTGDARGDIGFSLAKKNRTAQCTNNPSMADCLLRGNDLYGVFTIEFDGQWGPYLQCNPEQIGGADPILKPDWSDDRNFICGQDCLAPTSTGCHSPFPTNHTNTTEDSSFGTKCFCDGTQRHHLTVGRSQPSFLKAGSWGSGGVPSSWVPQCQTGFYQVDDGQCLIGTVYKTLQAWSFDSAAALGCEACTDDLQCTGWSTKDNRTVELFAGNTSNVSGSCTGATTDGGSMSKQKSWFGVGTFGGFWYSTPVGGECPKGAPLGTGGCTWREVSSSYKNASCVVGKVDDSVEKFGAVCFNDCSQPLNRTSDCYLDCYRSILMGNAAINMSKIPGSEIVNPWLTAFDEKDPALGGCPEVTTDPCDSEQCDPLLPPSSLAIVI